MNIIFKAISICLITVVLWVTLSTYNKNAAILLSLCACCGILIPAYEYLSPVMQYFEELQQNSGWDNSAMQTVIRAAGIGKAFHRQDGDRGSSVEYRESGGQDLCR